MSSPKHLQLSDASKYQLLVDSITDYAIYMLDPDGHVVSWNSGARRFKGYEAAEIIGSHFSRFYTPEDRAAGVPARALATAAEDGKFETEGWRVRKDGTRLWTHVVIDPVRDIEGNLLGFAKITRDLTERKKAQDDLLKSMEQFRLLVQGVTDYAIYMLDPRGHVSSWNSGAERIKGYSAAEIIGQHFSVFYVPEEQLKELPQKGLAIASAQGRFEKEGIRVRKDGTRFWAHVVIDAIRDERGELLGFAKITRDITERIETQRSLEQAREALFQAQKMEAVGQLTGGIAHDFNNLLTAVMGSLELLRKRVPAEPKITALMDNAVLGIQRGAALTQRMLAFARRQDLHTSSVSVADIVQEMGGLLEKSLGLRMKMEIRFPVALPPVEADANQLETAVLNLAVNARDSMPNGGTILISGYQESVGPHHATRLKPGQYVCLSVSDSGHGMNEAVLSRAMEPFYTTKGVGKGTGLGLSMIHGMAEQSGGRLVLRSMQGIGTTAEIWLPVSNRPVEAESIASAPLAPGLRPLNILVVDDDELVLNNIVQMLEDSGHSVIRTSSGPEALQVLGSPHQIDILVTDHAMPEMTGVQLATEALSQRPELPILLVSGYVEIQGEIDPRIGRLAKPFSQAELLEGIAGVLPR